MGLFKKKKRELAKDQVPFSSLSFKQKVSYLWEYYRWNAFAVIVVGTVLFFMIRHFVLYINPDLEIVIVDEGYEKEITALVQDYRASIGAKEWDVTIDEMEIGTKEEGGGYGTAGSLPLVVRLSTRMQDIVILSEEEFTDFASFGYFDDISDVLNDEFKEAYLDVTVIDNGDSKNFSVGETHAFGIKISDLVDDLESDFGKDAVIAIGVGAKHTEKSTEFIEYLANR